MNTTLGLSWLNGDHTLLIPTALGLSGKSHDSVYIEHVVPEPQDTASDKNISTSVKVH